MYVELCSKGNPGRCLSVNTSPYVQGSYNKINVSTLCAGLLIDLISQSPNDHNDKILLDIKFLIEKIVYSVSRKAKIESEDGQ